MTETTSSAVGDFSRLVDEGPLGYVAADASGRIETVNSTLLRWLGFEREQLVGVKTFQQLLAPGGRIYYDTHLRPMMHVQREISEIALELVRADGGRLPVLVNVQSLASDGANDANGFAFLLFDATERRRYEQELLLERQAAERSEARLALMYDVVSGMAATTTLDDVVHVIASRGAAAAEGVKCSVWLFDEGEHGAVRYGAADESTGELVRLAFPEGGAALDVLRQGDLVVVSDSHGADAYPLLAGWLRQSDRRSALIAPLITAGRLRGVLSYGFGDPHDFDDAERRALASLAAQTEQALERASALEAERRSRGRLEQLFRFSAVLAELATVDDVLDSIVDSSLSLLGASGARVALVDQTDFAVRYDRSAGVLSTGGTSPLDDARTVEFAALQTGEVIVTSTRAEHEALFPASPLLDQPSIGRVIASPLTSEGKLHGVWLSVYGEAALSDDDDTKLMRLFMEQAGHALGRAMLVESEVLGRQRAETRRRISEALNRAVTTADVGAALVVEGRRPFGADGLALLSVDGRSLNLVAQAGLDDVDGDALSRLSIWMPGERAFQVTEPIHADGRDAVGAALAGLPSASRWGSAALVPLYNAGQACGLIVAVFHSDERLGDDARVALWSLASEAGVAMARARMYELEHEVAITLQRSLLEPISPVPGWQIDTSYVPGSDELVVGGDLFDVTGFDDGRVVVIVGDVVGHGLEAAASMGQLRSAAKSLALVISTPGEMLDALDRFARLTPGVMYASVCCVMFGADGAGQYACAGHPYPVLVTADGQADLLDEGRSPLLGVGAGPRNAAMVNVPAGATLVMYTDGLVERRDTPVDARIERVREAVGRLDFEAPAEHAQMIIDDMLDGSPPSDDVVVVCVTRAAPR